MVTVKCNDNPLLLELLATLGLNFSCGNKLEIQSLLGLGVDTPRIISGNPCKTHSFIKHAAAVGIDLLTFDSEMELHKIKIVHPSAQVMLCIHLENGDENVSQFGFKFGSDINHVEHLLEVARELELDVVGVSFHVGSNCVDKTDYDKAIHSARQVFDKAISMNFNMTILNIGGGFPGAKKESPDFDEIAHAVNQALEKHFPLDSGVDIVAEPGRYFSTSAFTLCANVIAERQVGAPNKDDPVMMYYLSDGIYGSFSSLLFEQSKFNPVPLVDTADNTGVNCSLWGPTCDTLDQIIEKCTLPIMTVGDWIMFENMGSYNLSLASAMNGFQKPEIKIILPVATCMFLQELPGWVCLAQSLEGNKEHVQVSKEEKLQEALPYTQFPFRDIIKI
ncbi:ornithine decarboxylase-like isoform X2 [Limulus polyphemus]|uniref:Ornithine decarboxylase-like isoform X2 n=1 Tax=Limulus polyphemus TaxID=6850 RepID=A0ABM1SHA6_LIMPO|nr:ornithine decarboxylase-like isoform X2 [Limulus polyphemus]